MSAVIVPILPDQIDAWKAWNREVVEDRKAEFNDFNDRFGITSHRVWFAESPDGPVAVVVHDGPGADSFMGKVAESEHEFDQWFRESISRFHGVDFSQPFPGPAPVSMLEWSKE